MTWRGFFPWTRRVPWTGRWPRHQRYRAMTTQCLPDPHHATRWPGLSELIAEQMGLDFPHERLADLQRGLAGAADEFGFDDVAGCVDWLLFAPLTRTEL